MTALRGLAVALAALLVYALYLPATHAPARFIEQLRLEHERNAAFWGALHASRILARSLALYGQRDALVPAAFAGSPDEAAPTADGALVQHMSDIVQRLFNNTYARAFAAMCLLASYRLSVLAEWLPWVASFVLLACIDGYLVRSIRCAEFLEHSPTRFGLCVFGAVVVLGGTLLMLVIPAVIDPLALGAAPLALGGLIARAISDFNR
jgi:hypothetical protein